MHTIIRNYTGVPGLANELKKHSKSIETEISAVPGFIAYYMLDTGDGIASVTICENRNGCEESTKRAANWLRQNVPNLKTGAPQVTTGEVMFKFASKTIKV